MTEPAAAVDSGEGGGPLGRLLDTAMMVAGVLAFAFSLIDYYTLSFTAGGVLVETERASAWHGFFGWFAAVLALVAAAVVALSVYTPGSARPAGQVRVTALGLYALATAFVVAALFVWPAARSVASQVGGVSVDEGRGIGYWLSLAVVAAGALAAGLRVWQLRGSQTTRPPDAG